MEEKTIYIHYGDSSFRPELVGPNHNNNWHNKPLNALWASPKNAERSWKNWCLEESFRLDDLREWFEFTLKDDVKIFCIRSSDDEKGLPTINTGLLFLRIYDWDRLKESGYDAVEISLSDCWGLYDAMYGWDCDSIAILNPNAIDKITCRHYREEPSEIDEEIEEALKRLEDWA